MSSPLWLVEVRGEGGEVTGGEEKEVRSFASSIREVGVKDVLAFAIVKRSDICKYYGKSCCAARVQ